MTHPRLNSQHFRSPRASTAAVLLGAALTYACGAPEAPQATLPDEPLVVDVENGGVFVHLFEWAWNDIAVECETFLGPKGYAAVQISPPQESRPGDAWWTRYQPRSYEITGRSGNRAEFAEMVQRCNAAGVAIYADMVINHMSAENTTTFPKVPYGFNDFHERNCRGIDYTNRDQVQNCDLVGLKDLRTESEYVRGKIAEYFNDLISLGVDGFRVDAAKHMPAGDVGNILSRVNGNFYAFQEVIGAVSEPIKPEEYVGNADVTEFGFHFQSTEFFLNNRPLRDLRSITDGLLNSNHAVIFVDNHDTQRDHPERLDYKEDIYEAATVFMLAFPYGYPKVMSSYKFDQKDDAPPTSGVHSGNACFSGGWQCEHRYRGIANMVEFRNQAQGQPLNQWQVMTDNAVAFGRGDRAFVALNKEFSEVTRTLSTDMPDGTYCDIIHADFEDGTCIDGAQNGSTVTVANGQATLTVPARSAVAFHIGVRLDGTVPPPPPPPAATFYFRGTANDWGLTELEAQNGLYTTCQDFENGDGNGEPRFKIAADTTWSEAYPAEDFVVAGNTSYDITFDEASKAITATARETRCDGTGGNPGGNPGSDIDVTFTCNNGTTVPGQSIYVVGNNDALGNWNPAEAVKLNPTAYPTWTGQIALESNIEVQWKCIKRSEGNPNGQLVWQGGGNNTVTPSTTINETTGSF